MVVGNIGNLSISNIVCKNIVCLALPLRFFPGLENKKFAAEVKHFTQFSNFHLV
jgi:hypothetical protein